jgi:hypothetical protein
VTAIVAFENEDGAWIGADSFYGGPENADCLADETPKLFEVGPLLIAVSGSLRLGQLIQYALPAPVPTVGEADAAFMVRFANSLAALLREHDHASKGDRNGSSLPCDGASEVVALYRGRAYAITGSFSVSRTRRGYYAGGSGWAFICGALSVTSGMEPEARIKAALAAAADHSPTVRPPFIIRHQPRGVVGQ